MRTQHTSVFQVLLHWILLNINFISLISDISLDLFVDPVFIETSLGTRVEISCILESDFNVSPVWMREGSEALPSGTDVRCRIVLSGEVTSLH